MRYQILWGPIAEQLLAAIWLASSDRNSIAHAAAWFDVQLATNPLSLGESRSSSVHRVAFHGPIGIEFEVIEDDKRVIVRAVFAAG